MYIGTVGRHVQLPHECAVEQGLTGRQFPAPCLQGPGANKKGGAGEKNNLPVLLDYTAQHLVFKALAPIKKRAQVYFLDYGIVFDFVFG